jgi:hypothetical protein
MDPISRNPVSFHTVMSPSGISSHIAIKLAEVGVDARNADCIFPKPTGRFPIGIQSYVLQDGDRLVGISIHYPSKEGASFRHHPLEPYIDELSKAEPHVDPARYANCCSSAQPGGSPVGGSFPVVLMGHGDGMRCNG